MGRDFGPKNRLIAEQRRRLQQKSMREEECRKREEEKKKQREYEATLRLEALAKSTMTPCDPGHMPGLSSPLLSMCLEV